MLKKKIYVYLVFLSILIVGLLIYPDYGFNIDEKFHRSNGFYWLYYVSDFFGLEQLKLSSKVKLESIKGFTLSPIEHFNKYGVIFDLPAAFLEIIFKIDEPIKFYQFRHLLVFIFFFIGSIYFYKILYNRFQNEWISIFGLLLFILTPRLFGDSFHNTKDIIFLSLYSVSFFYFFKTIDNESKYNSILFGLFAAISTTLRIVGIFLPISLVFIWFLGVVSKKSEIKASTVLICIFSYLFSLIIFWPLLWENTVHNFLGYFKILDHYFGSKIFFLGNYYPSDKLPYYYLIFWIFISTPLIHLILFLSGFGFYLRRIIKRFFAIKDSSIYNDLWRSNNEKKDFLIFLNLVVFFLFFTFMNIKLYNSWRLAYFLYIFIIYFGTYSVYLLFQIIKKNENYKKLKNFFLISLIFCFIFSIYRIYIYHPYQSFYFNILTTKNIKDNVEVDYTGLSGINFLNEIIDNEPGEHKIKVGIASWYPLWRMVELLDQNKINRIKILSNDKRSDSDYIYSNRISDVDKRFDKKYNVPKNFKIIKEYKIDEAIIYEVYQKSK